jgi:hypothetical protein
MLGEFAISESPISGFPLAVVIALLCADFEIRPMLSAEVTTAPVLSGDVAIEKCE